MPNKIHKTDWTLRISMIILAVTGILAYANTADLINKNKSVTYTYEVINALDLAKNILLDAETGQRGFLLTGKESYLEPYKDAETRIRPIADYLGSLIKNRDIQQKRLYNLKVEINRKMAELKNTIEIRRKAGLNDAMTIVETDSGKNYMTNIRTIISEMKEDEQELLFFHLRASSITGYRCLWIFPLLIVLDIIVTNVSLVLLSNERGY